MNSIENLEAEVSLLNEKLTAAALHHDEFINLAAHDLHAPLRKLSTFTDLLLNKIPSIADPKIIQYGDKIQECVQQMRELLERITTLAECEFLTLPLVNCDLNQIVLRESERLAKNYPQCNILIIRDPLPIIEGNHKQLTQLFSELIQNSLEYSQKVKSAKIHIYYKSVTGEDLLLLPEGCDSQNYYKVVVADNGIGITAEASGRLFLPFQRGHGSSEYAGHGLGLAICKKIVNNHHGMIYATSNEQVTELIMILVKKQTYSC